MAVNSRVQRSIALKMLVLDSLSTSLIRTICSCTSTHRFRTNGRWTRAIVNALRPVADMELLAQMTTTTVVDRLLVDTVRVVTTGSALLVDDRMTTMAEETMDGAHHHETLMDHRRHLDENHMATTLTTEAVHHHREAMPIRTSEMVIRTLGGQGVHQEQGMEVVMQLIMTEDTGEAPASIQDSTLWPSVESHLLKLIRIDRVHRGHIIAERICFRSSTDLVEDSNLTPGGIMSGKFCRMVHGCTELNGGGEGSIFQVGAVGSCPTWKLAGRFLCYASKVTHVTATSSRLVEQF